MMLQANFYLAPKWYRVCDHLEGCTLRLVHTHPPNGFGEDLRFSRNDIRSSYNIKAILDKMGVNVHMREDIIVSDRNGGIYLFSYTLPKDFTYESGHYWSGSSILKQLKKSSDAIAAVPEALKNKYKESREQFRKALGVTSNSTEITPTLKKLLPLVDEQRKTIIAIADSSDPGFERPQIGILDSGKEPIAEITLALTSTDQLLPLLQERKHIEKRA